jgi:hypothetical protein
VEKSGVLGDEQGAVGEDGYVLVGALEEVTPDGVWDGPAVWVDGLDLGGEGSLPWGGLGPEFGFVDVEEVGDGPAVAWVGDAVWGSTVSAAARSVGWRRAVARAWRRLSFMGRLLLSEAVLAWDINTRRP